MARGKPVSDFKKGQVIAYSKCISIRKIAANVKLPKSAVNDIVKRYRKY